MLLDRKTLEWTEAYLREHGFIDAANDIKHAISQLLKAEKNET